LGFNKTDNTKRPKKTLLIPSDKGIVQHKKINGINEK
jgi:hypothetical protein